VQRDQNVATLLEHDIAGAGNTHRAAVTGAVHRQLADLRTCGGVEDS
jgi:hypothetical protein